MGLRSQIGQYKAIRKNVLMGPYGLWNVTYSCAPGVDLTVTICQTGITPERAAELGDATLKLQTGQEVMQ